MRAFHPKIEAMTFKDYCEKHDVEEADYWHNKLVILDEADKILKKYPLYVSAMNRMYGLWQLKERRVIAFTATLSEDARVFIEQNLINSSTELKINQFESMYTFLNNKPQIVDRIVPCADVKAMEAQLIKNIYEYYGKQPLICIVTDELKKRLMELGHRKGWSVFSEVSEENL